MWLMILVGVTMATGFVLALRSQINAHHLGQAEERLKVKLDEYASQQKFLMLDQQRALSASESDRAGRQGGLDQLKLDGPEVVRNASVQGVVQQVSDTAKPPQATQQNRQAGDRPGKQPVKLDKAAKPSAKKTPMKSNAATSRAAQAKSKKASVTRQQASRSQKKR